VSSAIAPEYIGHCDDKRNQNVVFLLGEQMRFYPVIALNYENRPVIFTLNSSKAQ
jgi:hypothetical protein